MSADFIAEVCSNHNRDLYRCFKFIDIAAEIGCAAVKFQLFRVRELFAPEILERSPEHRRREAWELPVEFLPELAERCRRRRIRFWCTPFYLGAVDELEPYIKTYKIASYDLLRDDLLAACARTRKPVVVSTGMATLDEVRHAVGILKDAGCRSLKLMHCLSVYPAPPESCNLKAIETLEDEFHGSVGWSDHTVNPAVISRAIDRWGAESIEFHLDLDGSGAEAAVGHCWRPDQIAPVIKKFGNKWFFNREGEEEAPSPMDGNGRKEPAAIEVQERQWRADPADGLRPMRSIRASFKGDA